MVRSSPPGLKPIWGTGSGEFPTLFRVALPDHYRHGKPPLPSGCFCATFTIGSMQRPGELAEALTMTRGAISKIIDKLQVKGWIRSRIKPEDNRVQLLSLTAAGRRVVPELAEIADRNDDQFFGFLDIRERRAASRSPHQDRKSSSDPRCSV